MTLGIALAIVLAVGGCRSDAEKGPPPPGVAPSHAGLASAVISSDASVSLPELDAASGGATDLLTPSQPEGVSERNGDVGQGPERPSAKVVAAGPKVAYHATYAVPVEQAEVVLRTQLLPVARNCYYAAVKRDDRDAGKLTMLLTVTPAGGIKHVTITSRSVSRDLAACVTSAAQRLSFHRIPGANGSSISVEFVFSTPQHPVPETFSPDPPTRPGRITPL